MARCSITGFLGVLGLFFFKNVSFKMVDFVYFSIVLMFIHYWIEESVARTAVSPNVVHQAPDGEILFNSM